MENSVSFDQIKKRTEFAYLWVCLLDVPFWGLINLLPLILYKNIHISPLIITIIITLKPVSALFAPYWSQLSRKYFPSIAHNLIWANLLRYVPFLFTPWIDSSWPIIVAFGFYMVLYRGSVPIWMEIIKCNLPEQSRERLVSRGLIMNYCGFAFLPIILGTILDGSDSSWRWLFLVTALIGLLSTFFIYRIPFPIVNNVNGLLIINNSQLSFFESLIKPWKQSWQIMRQRPDFAIFQVGFMFGGAGLMIMQPTLPIFFVDVLNLSFTEMLSALTAFKGLGFVLTSPLWVKFFRNRNIYHFYGLVIFLAGLYPFLVIGAQYNILLLYVAYGLYGIMQSGSELGWHMSGPIFSRECDSVPFSETNAHMVGIRGCIAPSIGTLLLTLTNPSTVMITCSILCIISFFIFAICDFSIKKLASALQNIVEPSP